MDSSLDSLYRVFSCCWYAWQGPRWRSAAARRGGHGGGGDKDGVGDGGIQEEGGGGCGGGIGGGACEGGGRRADDDEDTPSTDATGARIRYETLTHHGGGGGGGGGGGAGGGGSDRSEEILHLLRHSFFREEALVSSMWGAWSSGPGGLLPALAHRLLQQGVSVAAVEEESGRVVGIAVNLIVHHDDPATHPYRLLQDHLMPERNSKLHEVARLLRELQAGQFEGRELCVLLVNVERHYAGRGIGRELLGRSVAVARAAGAHRALGHATGEPAARIYAAQGFRPAREVRAPGDPSSRPPALVLYAKELLPGAAAR